MKHLALGVATYAIVVALVTLLSPGDLWAHGGQFRGPGDQVPPGLRDPFDPTPPPPPPPPTPGPPPISTPFGPTQGSPTTPLPTGTPPVTTTPTGGQPKRRGGSTLSYADWVFWYHYNKDDIENLKWSLYHPLSSENPIFQTGHGRGGTQRDAYMRLTQKQVQAKVIPALLWAMDPSNIDYSDIEGAAYIALAKVSKDPQHIDKLMAGLDLGRKRHHVVQESAALALGLLRRADPADQFTARELDKARALLFDVLDDARHATRVRGFAAVALGLLGDQPTGSGEYANDTATAAAATTTRLFEALRSPFKDENLYVGVLMAIGLQPATSVTPEQRELLAECAMKRRLGREKAGALTQSYATLALGRIGAAGDIRSLENILNARSSTVSQQTRASAAIGLGQLGRLVDGQDRVRAAQVLLRTVETSRDESTPNFAIMSLAQLLVEDAKANRTDVLGNTRADEMLIEKARKGRHLERGFGAMALGLVLRQIERNLDVDAWQSFREDAVQTLRDGLARQSQDKKSRAAFATALGIARDGGSRKALLAIVDDRDADKMLRSYAALALGLIGRSDGDTARAIAGALRERSSEDLRRQSATALGLLGNPTVPGTGKDAVEILLDELKSARTQSHKGQIVLALARVGDHRALDGLEALLMDPKENELTRALACAGLGLVGDLEWIPSIARGSRNINYRASTDLIDEFLSIL